MKLSKKLLAIILSMALILSAFGTVVAMASNDISDYTLLNDASGKATATLVTDPLSVKSGNVIKVDSTGTTQTGKVAFYKSIAVEPDTDYTWTFDAYVAASDHHRFGVVAGNTVVNTNNNVTLDITMTANPGNITVSDTGSDSGGEYVAKIKGTWNGDPNWKYINTTYQTWATFTVSFNSGSNTNVCLAYAPRAAGRIIYFTDWVAKKIIKPVEGYSLVNDASGNAIATLAADPLSLKSGNVIKVDTTGTTQVGKVAFYKSIAVKKNTNYVWTFDAYIAAHDHHRFGVVAGDTVVNTNNNVTLDITMTANPGNITVSDTGSDAGGEYVAMTKGTWNGDPNWKYINTTYETWATFTVSFNSGNNTNVCLAYAPRAAGRTIYFTDWDLTASAPIAKLVNGDFETTGAEDNKIPGYKVLLPSSGAVASVVTNAPGRTGNVLKMDATNYTDKSYNKFGIYQPVQVQKNTDYVWTFDMNCTNGANHFIGVVAGDTVVNTGCTNVTLPITMKVDTSGVTIGTNAQSGEYICATTNWAADGNWKMMGDFNKWGKFTVRFNSGDNTTVCLAYATYAAGRIAYLDNWSLVESDGTNLINGSFENGLAGYEIEGNISAEVVENDDTFSARIQGDTASANSFYQKITVYPKTEYVWTFEYKTVQGGNTMFGVRSGNDATKLIPSAINVSTGSLSNARFFEYRTNGFANWHQGASSQVSTVTVKFYTCDETEVYLSICPVNNARIIETSNWSIEKSTTKKGDSNADGKFDANDLTTIVKALLGSLTTSDQYSVIGLDSNGDYSVNILDLIHMKKSFVSNDLPDGISGYRLVWSEEFNSNTLNSSNIAAYPLMVSRSSDLELRNDETAITVNNGSLLLKSGYDSEKDVFFVDESVTTRGKMAYKYGYVEIKAKVPYGAPNMAAFWLQSARVDSDVLGEIDIFEAFPELDSGIQTGIHKWHPNGDHDVNNAEGKIGVYEFGDEDVAEAWHTYGMLWTETQLKFYVDGVCYHTIGIDNANNFGEGDMSSFGDYAYLILNNWLYTAGNTDSESTNYEYIADPDYFVDGTIDYEIDYIRLYQSAATGDIIYQ